jgi:hypothetical protein
MHTQFSVLKDISLDRSFGTITQDISFDNLVAWKLTEYQWIAYFRPMGWACGNGSVIPATAAGVTDRLWEMTDVVEMIEAWEATEQRKAA